MFYSTLSPRFYETDAFGHINNIVVAGWFETGREDIFRVFTPELDPKKLPLILARIEVDFVAQIYYGADVEVRTGIEKFGRTSFVVVQEAWQKGQLVARGRAVQVYFNHHTQKSEPLPASARQVLEQHLVADDTSAS